MKEDDTVLINKLTQLEDKLNETQLSHETRYSQLQEEAARIDENLGQENKEREVSDSS